MEVQIAVDKVNKYATSESGDTVEVIERPAGGLSIVVADGQSSGKGAKRISNMVVRKVISLLAEGVRDGAAARAASDYLYTERKGKVSATLNIISIDLQTSTLVITRNNPAPVIIRKPEEMTTIAGESIPIGLYRATRPVIDEIPLVKDLTVVVFTDGIVHAGERYGKKMQIEEFLQELLKSPDISPQDVSDALLKHAVQLDQGRPSDDVSVAVIGVRRITSEDSVRRMSLRVPLT